MYLGIDLGTSGVKVVLLDESGRILQSESAPLTVSRPRPLWSEQSPTSWWTAVQTAVGSLGDRTPLSDLQAVGLTGQMHGATFLDGAGEPVRPAILWNDGRSAAECEELETLVPDAGRITGNRIMPGFTAPKVLWLAKHEPEAFAATRTVLLPKDYLRYLLTGDYASDMSDASGTMWLDVARRAWDEELLTACRIGPDHMPEVYEGPELTGCIREEVARAWRCPRIPVTAGAGDNAGGALGVGLTRPGQAMLSLGTSGTYFVVTGEVARNPKQAVHSFCHALPDTWHLMAVTLSAASCLTWLQKVTGAASVETLLEEATAVDGTSGAIFLPYLAGERTPHNDPEASGVFFGLTHRTERGHLTRAVLEGVAFALADGADAVHRVVPPPSEVTVIGGGARSAFWSQLLADTFGRPLTHRKGGDVGPALGAARLALRSVSPKLPSEQVFPTPELLRVYDPRTDKSAELHEKRIIFRELYERVQTLPRRIAHS